MKRLIEDLTFTQLIKNYASLKLNQNPEEIELFFKAIETLPGQKKYKYKAKLKKII